MIKKRITANMWPVEYVGDIHIEVSNQEYPKLWLTEDIKEGVSTDDLRTLGKFLIDSANDIDKDVDFMKSIHDIY